MSNPASRHDAFGNWAEPKDGWDSVDVMVADFWRTKWGGKYIRLDGERSPNVLAGETIYPFLPTEEQLQEDRELLGAESRLYMRMVRAVFFDSDEAEGVYTHRVMWVGIDNGLEGGLCAIDREGRPFRYCRMPKKNVRGRGALDLAEVVSWLRGLGARLQLVVEEAPHHGDSSSAIRSLGIGYGKLLALEDLLSYDLTIVAPQTWQRQMLPKGPGSTKARAEAAARTLAPEESWIPPRCRTPHDGIIDAFLMARWAQDNNK